MREGEPGHPVFAACWVVVGRLGDRGPVGQARRELVAGATGDVLDLGAGRGANLAHLPASVRTVHLVEPDPNMLRALERAAPPSAVVHRAGAERLPLRDASVDTALSTLTLCTVDDVTAAAAELRRVLRPDGRLLLLEHVAATDPATLRWQRRLRRPWSALGGGCSLTRDPTAALSTAGFAVGGLERRRLAVAPVRDWLVGAAVPA